MGTATQKLLLYFITHFLNNKKNNWNKIVGGRDMIKLHLLTCLTTTVFGNVVVETTDWTQWSDCSVSCGLGIRRRERECLADETQCAGVDQMYFQNVAICDKGPCCSNWSAWSECCLELKSCLVEPLSGTREDLVDDFPACRVKDDTPVV